MPIFCRADQDDVLEYYYELRSMNVEVEHARELVKEPTLRYYTKKFEAIAAAIRAGASGSEIAEVCREYAHTPAYMDTYLRRRCEHKSHNRARQHSSLRRVHLTSR